MHERVGRVPVPGVRAQRARTVRKPRTAFGGLVPANVGQVTRLLIAVNVVAFIIQQTSSDVTSGSLQLMPTRPCCTGRSDVYDGVANGEYYRLITSAFLHAGVLHILFNMYALLVVGPTRRGGARRSRFIALYSARHFGGLGARLPADAAAERCRRRVRGDLRAVRRVVRRHPADG